MEEKFYDLYLAQADKIISDMTLYEKLGQMVVPTTTIIIPDSEKAVYSDKMNDEELVKIFGLDKIKKYHIGSLLVGGNDMPFDANDPGIEMWQKIARISQTQYAGPEGTFLLLGTDAVHGNQHIPGLPLIPHNIGMGATHNLELIKETACLAGKSVLFSGFNWIFAPTVAVAYDYRWGRTYESYSSIPELVKEMSKAYVEGVQNINENRITGSLATIKHFIGDGATKDGLDEGNAVTGDFEEFWKDNGAGYEGGIEANAGSLMPSYSSLNGIPMHFGGDWDVLKKFTTTGINGYSFKGFVVSDYAAISKAQAKYNMLNKEKISFPDALAKSINSGVDMIMIGVFNTSIPDKYNDAFLGKQSDNIKDYDVIENPLSWEITKEGYNYSGIEGLLKGMKTAVEYGKISMDRINDAVRRVIAVKLAMNARMPKEVDLEKERKLALAAAEQSLVLLKNDKKTIPLKAEKIKNVILMGDYDNIGLQNGGWTITWQGVDNNKYWEFGSEWKKQSGATSIKDGIEISASGNANLIDGIEGLNIETIDRLEENDTIAIVVLSEVPYAEYKGDIDNDNPLFIDDHTEDCYTEFPQNRFLGLKFNEQVASKVKMLRKKGIKVITVILSGRPMIITEGGDKAPLNNSDALIAAWLPGTSGGEAVANTIFGSNKLKSVKTKIGDKEYYSNTLPFAWPKNMDEVRNGKYTLFPVGYGLGNC